MREHRKVFKMIALISQIGITMLSSIFICGWIGYLLDHRFGTHLFPVTLILGIAGGYRAVYSLIKQSMKAKDAAATDGGEGNSLPEGEDRSKISQEELHEAAEEEGGPEK